MKRIFFLVPNVISSTRIVEELHSEDISDRNIHIVGSDHDILKKAHLHEANLLQTTGVVQALLMGAFFGLLIGLVLGGLVVYFPPEGLELGWLVVVGLGIFGAGFGAWVSSLIGISIEDPVIESFHRGIELGQLLMIVDVPKVREREIISKIKTHHPEASITSKKIKGKE